MTTLNVGVPDRIQEGDAQDDLASHRQTHTILIFVLALVIGVLAFGLYALRAGA